MSTSTIASKMTKKKTENYVNNREFLDALVVYKLQCDEATRQGTQRPRIPNYIGECFYKIATHLSYKPNFVNYMFRDDMIGDAVENCVQYIDRFDPAKSTNPFAYFTQMIYFAFLRRIAKEKKQLETKNKLLERSGYDEVLHTDSYSGDMIGYNSSSADMNSIKENLEMRSKR
jgi:hypothetical protein